MNELPGSFFQLPKPRQISPDTAFTQLEIHAGNFALAYSEEVLDIEQQYPLGLNYWGRYWLGNTEDETKTLVDWMQQNPEEVADYLNWTFGEPNSPHPYAEELRVRAKEGKLKEPKFE